MYHSGTAQDPDASEYELRIRRMRLRLEGFMYSPKLLYFVQLSFSRGDMDWNIRETSTINTSPNVVRDAVVYYRPVPSLLLVFGQTKLPGNRQRVVSSGEQQFAERSIANAAYNIDRDFGIQAFYSNQVGGFFYRVKGAISSGEGRNIVTTDNGLAYTGRLELLPLGKFKNDGDYFEGDLEREETLKVSLAGGMSHNQKARRTGGQIGGDLYEQRDMNTYIFDGILKYRGFALYAEHMAREADNPFTANQAGDARYILTGTGQNFQASYIFKNNLELAGRYARVSPAAEVQTVARQETNYVAGLTKYLRWHRLKLQTNIYYNTYRHYPTNTTTDSWSGGFQIELGI